MIGSYGYNDSFKVAASSGRPEDMDKGLKKSVWVRPTTTVEQLKEMGRNLFAPRPASRIEMKKDPNPYGAGPLEIQKKYCRMIMRELEERLRGGARDELIFHYD